MTPSMMNNSATEQASLAPPHWSWSILTSNADSAFLPSAPPAWEDRNMPSSNLAYLLELPADERAELAMALWESLTD
jgi:hypothetical protein